MFIVKSSEKSSNYACWLDRLFPVETFHQLRGACETYLRRSCWALFNYGCARKKVLNLCVSMLLS